MKNCLICSVEFLPKNSLQKYCCFKCKKKANVKTTIVKRSEQRKKTFEEKDNDKECLVCGEVFTLKQQHQFQKYCSKICLRKAEKIFGDKKEQDAKYHDNIRFSGNRSKALLRDNYECQMCGNKSKLIVHHKDGSGETCGTIDKQINVNNDINNLVTLCRRCHINIHRIGLVGSTGL